MTSGTAPPTKNTERQPKSGISHNATKPPTAAPAVKPTVMPIVSVTRLRFGLNSPTSAVAFGMMQPRPSPEMSRSHEQLLDVLREAGGDREGREPERRADDHRAAADPVGEHAEEQRPDQHADVGGGEDRPERRAGHAEVAEHGRGDVAHRLHVEAVHDQADHAEREDADLQRPDGAVFQEFGEVDLGRGGRVRSWPAQYNPSPLSLFQRPQ